jgi:uncharacterized protein YqgQ
METLIQGGSDFSDDRDHTLDRTLNNIDVAQVLLKYGYVMNVDNRSYPLETLKLNYIYNPSEKHFEACAIALERESNEDLSSRFC